MGFFFYHRNCALIQDSILPLHVIFRNLGTSYELLRDWSSFSNTSSSVTWLNFDLEHKDQVKTRLKVTNGALNSVTQDTDGFVVDLSPPELEYLWDGSGSSDIMYQVQVLAVTILLTNVTHIDVYPCIFFCVAGCDRSH